MITQISKLEVGRVDFFAMVDTVRDKKNMQFIVVKDFSSKIQLFIDKVKYPDIIQEYRFELQDIESQAGVVEPK